MPKESKLVKCVDCGQEFRRKELNHNFRCHDCRIKIIRDTIKQLRGHEEPQCKKWKQVLQEAARRL